MDRTKVLEIRAQEPVRQPAVQKLRDQSEFLRSAAAELRTPLTIVLAAVEQKAIPVNDKERAVLRSSTRQLLDLTREFSRPTTQEWPSPTVTESVRLSEFRDEVIAHNQGRFREKDIVLDCSAPQNVSVGIARVHLGELVNNLVSNAWKYSPRGSKVELCFSTPHKKLLISVKDAGCGVPTADRVRIFEPFFRTAKTSEIAGTGLGLAAVKRIAELYNGSARVEPRLPHGSEFLVELPVAVEQLASHEVFA